MQSFEEYGAKAVTRVKYASATGCIVSAAALLVEIVRGVLELPAGHRVAELPSLFATDGSGEPFVRTFLLLFVGASAVLYFASRAALRWTGHE
jgi:hypothetical protein